MALREVVAQRGHPSLHLLALPCLAKPSHAVPSLALPRLARPRPTVLYGAAFWLAMIRARSYIARSSLISDISPAPLGAIPTCTKACCKVNNFSWLVGAIRLDVVGAGRMVLGINVRRLGMNENTDANFDTSFRPSLPGESET